MASERSASSPDELDRRRERGVLFGSGLVGGEGLFMVVIALYAAWTAEQPQGIGYEWAGNLGPWLAAAVFVGLMGFFYRLSTRPGKD
jgi:hypothetical protein